VVRLFTHLRMAIGTRKVKYWKINLPQCYSTHYSSETDCSGIEAVLLPWEVDALAVSILSWRALLVITS
jgi:hypothetical protein